MDGKKQGKRQLKIRLINFGGKNRRFYTAAAAMLLLVLVPFALYAALNAGNNLLEGILFAVIGAAMVLILLAA